MGKAPALILPAHLGSGPVPIQTEHHYPVFIDTGNAPNLAYLMRCAGLADPAVPVTMWLTSSVWASLVRELVSLPDELWMDPTRKPTPETFQRMALTKKFTIANSGTEDQAHCDRLNEPADRECNFRGRHDRLAVRAGEKKPAIEAIDAESTH